MKTKTFYSRKNIFDYVKFYFYEYAKFIPYAIIIILLAIIFFMQKCDKQKLLNNLTEIVSYKDSAKTYKDKYGFAISYNQSLILANKEALTVISLKEKQLYDLQKQFKNVKSANNIKWKVELIHDTIRFTDTIPCEFEQFYLTDSNKFYNVKAYIAPSFFMIDTLYFLNEQSIFIGTKNFGFFRPAEHRIEIKNSNPYVITTNINSYTVKNKPKWYETKAFIFGAGIVSGLAVNSWLKK